MTHKQDTLEDKIKARIESVRAFRDDLVAQVTQCNAVIGELEALIKPADSKEEVTDNLPASN